MCYEGYCLGLTSVPDGSLSSDSLSPVDAHSDASADSAPSLDTAPTIDTATAPDSSPPVDVPVDSIDTADSAPDSSGTCSLLADGCCPPNLRNLHSDPDCLAPWPSGSLAFDRAAPFAIDAANGRFVLSFSDGIAGRVMVGSLSDGSLTTELLSFGAAPPPCPALMPDGSVILASGKSVSRVLPDGTVVFTKQILGHPASGCPALREKAGKAPTTIVVAAGQELVGLDPDSGALLWRWEEPSGAALSSPLVRNGVIVTASPTALWRIDEGAPTQGAPPVPTTSLSTPLPGTWLAPPSALGLQSTVLAVQGAKGALLVEAAFDAYEWAPASKEDLSAPPLPGAEIVEWHDGSPLLARQAGFVLNPPYDPKDIAPCGATIVTAPVVLADGTLLVGTSSGAAAVDITDEADVKWCFDAKAKALLPPVPLPGGDVLLVAKGALLRIKANVEPLSGSAWPMPRHDLRNTACDWH